MGNHSLHERSDESLGCSMTNPDNYSADVHIARGENPGRPGGQIPCRLIISMAVWRINVVRHVKSQRKYGAPLSAPSSDI